MPTILETARIHHATRAKAEKLADILAAEYAALQLRPLYNEDESTVSGFAVVHVEDEETSVYEGAKVPELSDLLDACEDMGLDPETPEVENERSGSVVPEEYRAMYREMSSNGQTCGDWLAEFLVLHTHGIDGFNVADFQAIIETNGLDQSRPWAKLPESGQAGWIGRYRMNGRQALEKLVAQRGWVKDASGNQHDLPEADLAILRRKHAKWLAKEVRKAEAAKAEAA